ncbi:hypothetical protein PSM_B0100 [Pseudoalteromonas sp. SM9913]|nr:hypothetical protein PSM_B0100 [Pseudoalteromonas sp. SM9913]
MLFTLLPNSSTPLKMFRLYKKHPQLFKSLSLVKLYEHLL